MIKRVLALFLIAVFFSLMLCACDFSDLFAESDETKIENRIQTFVSDYNSGDVEAVMASMTKRTRRILESTFGILGSISGYDVKELFVHGFSLGVLTSEGDYLSLEIVDVEVSEDSKKADANVVIKMDGSDTGAAVFKMKYENDGWYIDDIKDRE